MTENQLTDRIFSNYSSACSATKNYQNQSVFVNDSRSHSQWITVFHKGQHLNNKCQVMFACMLYDMCLMHGFHCLQMSRENAIKFLRDISMGIDYLENAYSANRQIDAAEDRVSVAIIE